jgi:uncharacterized protein with gpF-like domain
VVSFSPPDKLERQYQTQIIKVLRYWLPVKHKGVSSAIWLNEVATLTSKHAFKSDLTNLAASFIKKVEDSNKIAWRKLVRESSRTQYADGLINRHRNSNLKLKLESNVKNLVKLPSVVASQLKKESETENIELNDLSKRRFSDVLLTKINLEARTQINSTNSLVTQSRSNVVGSEYFIWSARLDRLSRFSHRALNGVIVSWKSLPNPETLAGVKSFLGNYAPGDCPNCRCSPTPIMKLADVFDKNSIVRFHLNGAILQINRAQFIKITGVEA